jgi:hypothetical protein
MITNCRMLRVLGVKVLEVKETKTGWKYPQFTYYDLENLKKITHPCLMSVDRCGLDSMSLTRRDCDSRDLKVIEECRKGLN